MVLEYLRALGLPIALIALAIAIVISAFVLTSRKRGPKQGFGNWEFEPGSTPSAPAPQPAAETHDARSLAFEPIGSRDGGDSKSDEQPEADSSQADSNYFHQFVTATTEEELETAFKQFKNNNHSDADGGEFWETFRITKRRELGIGDEEKELSVLSEQNRAWVWPLIHLMRRHVRLQDIDSAENALSQALARRSPENHKWVLREGVGLHYRLYGLKAAIRFIQTQLTSSCLDEEIKDMFSALATCSRIANDPFSFAVPREISLCFENKPTSDKFELAYSYGDNKSFPIPAYHHYKEILDKSDEWSSSPNNMGIILHEIDKRAEIEAFEQARKLGSRVAVANLANKLVDAGFVGVAEDLLANTPDGEDAEENLILARKNVLKARREMTKAKGDFQDFVAKQVAQYRSVIMDTYRFMRQADMLSLSGRYENTDHALQMIVEPECVRCRMKIGEAVLQGDLNLKPLCYDGFIMSTTGGLLNSTIIHITVFPLSAEEIKAVLWPTNIAMDAPLRIIKLTKVATPVPMQRTMQGAPVAHPTNDLAPADLPLPNLQPPPPPPS